MRAGTFTGSGQEYFRIWIVNLLLTGQTARLHPVQLTAAGDDLAVAGDKVALHYARTAATAIEPFAQAPLLLYFADGARCEIGEAGAGATRARWKATPTATRFPC